jgi:hypothetical protein
MNYINLYTNLLDVTAFPFELGAVTRASSQLVATLSVLVGAGALGALSTTKKVHEYISRRFFKTLNNKQSVGYIIIYPVEQ